MAGNTQKQGRGCFFYGGITLVLVLIGVIAGVYFGSRKAIFAVVAKYTATAPAEIPQLELPPSERDRIARQLAREARRAANGQGAPNLVLGEQELNVLLAQTPDLKSYTNQIYLQPEGNRLKAHLSVPLDQFEHWKSLQRKLGGDLANRYLNGTAYLDVGVTNGALNLSMAEMVVNGQSLPEEFTARVQSQNFASAANQDPDARAVLDKVEKIEVRDGKVHVDFKR